MPCFTRTREEQKMLDERDQKQADHKAQVQAENAEMVLRLKKAGVVKACPLCGHDQWTGCSMTLQGRKLEDEPAEDDVVGMFSHMLGGLPSKAVLTCLVLTCGTCTNMQFFNLKVLLETTKQA